MKEEFKIFFTVNLIFFNEPRNHPFRHAVPRKRSAPLRCSHLISCSSCCTYTSEGCKCVMTSDDSPVDSCPFDNEIQRAGGVFLVRYNPYRPGLLLDFAPHQPIVFLTFDLPGDIHSLLWWKTLEDTTFCQNPLQGDFVGVRI